MSSTTLKCNVCNIVIDELLAYIQNKISVSDEETIVKICASTFTSEQIEKSNKLLLESLPAELRKSNRKGKGKENRILTDIISILKGTDIELLPVFVARELEKLPPLTVDHLDVSKLLKVLALVQAEVRLIKESYVTRSQIEDFKNECHRNITSSSSSVPGAGINLNSLIYLKSKHDTAVGDKCGNQFLDHEATNTSHKKFTNLNYGEGRNMPIPWPTQKDRCESAESSRARPSSADGRCVDGGEEGGSATSQPPPTASGAADQCPEHEQLAKKRLPLLATAVTGED
ncbi:unnamed protein product [Arctia plantaginis]|uniref:Mutant cadherin n=1 Tax=Arctia plantaginis TaxID=874455 RepID=A0A8S0ZB09_ARCPL|nr:unnamed protein product [Arctia plantaginis]